MITLKRARTEAVGVTMVEGLSDSPSVGGSAGERWRRAVPLVLGVAAWIAVAILAAWRAHVALGHSTLGWDLRPLRIAGGALRSGHSIYSDPDFVYPPPAALAGWPLSFAHLHAAIVVYTYCEAAAIGLTVLLLRGCLRPVGWQLLVSAGLAGLLLRGDLVTSILWLDNVSVLLVLPCAFVLVRWGDGRWRSGAVMLGLTLMLKPVLLPLILIPVALRRWRTVAEALGVALIGLLVSLPLTNGAGSIGEVAQRLAEGSSLTGWQGVFNTSLAQFGEYHHVPTALTLLARMTVVAVAILAITRVVRGGRSVPRPSVAALGSLLLSAVFLAGPLAEDHYLMLLIPGALLMATLKDRLVLALLATAFLVAAYPAAYVHGVGDSVVTMQIRCIMIELLVFAASARSLTGWPGPRAGHSPDVAQPEVELASEESVEAPVG